MILSNFYLIKLKKEFTMVMSRYWLRMSGIWIPSRNLFIPFRRIRGASIRPRMVRFRERQNPYRLELIYQEDEYTYQPYYLTWNMTRHDAEMYVKRIQASRRTELP